MAATDRISLGLWHEQLGFLIPPPHSKENCLGKYVPDAPFNCERCLYDWALELAGTLVLEAHVITGPQRGDTVHDS